ncbi:MAG TPA: HIT family protein [Beijerinckiaceae bacterium]|jgi:diadenosine tetraphosphate (Ap4A) HIT family hydrolase
MSDFALDARLAADTMPVGDLALCAVLLMDDARFPWLILVPRRPGISELTDLSEADAAVLMQEIRMAARVVTDLAKPDKLNVGALGNIVQQLHVHVVGRFRSDPAWPGPVWGHGSRTPYPAHAAAALIERAATLFTAA